MDEQKVREYFNFNEADLNENRNGRISQSQLQRQQGKLKAYQKNRRGAAVILFVIAALGLLAGVYIIFTGRTEMGAKAVPGGVSFALVWSLIWGGLGMTMVRSDNMKLKFDVKSARGSVQLEAEGKSDNDFDYMLHVGEYYFDVDDNLSGTIMDGDQVIVYYLETTEEILSIESAGK
jgi:hypothetical protein